MVHIRHYILFLFTLNFDVVYCAKILMWPYPYLSHIRELSHIGDSLTENGHDLHLILPPSLQEIETFRSSTKFKLIEFELKYKDFNMLYKKDDDKYDVLLEVILTQSAVMGFRGAPMGVLESCLNPLEDKVLIQRLKKEQYDLAIIGAFPISRCYLIMMYNLDIPYVSVTTQYEPWLFKTPALPSFVPFALQRPPMTDKMTFLERVYNTYYLIDWTAFPGISNLDDCLVEKYAPEKPFVSLNWLAGRSLLWLIDTDIAVDYPRPTMANEINIGGLSTKPAEDLPLHLKQFMDNSPEGVIVASFGSLSVLPKKYMNILIDALKQVKLKVILRYDYKLRIDIPEHIKVEKWIPQNDLLGHRNTRLFITHCGANSQFEGLYHGVPMLNLPVLGDQPYNALRADYKGYSRTMDVLSMSSDDILHNINTILSDSSYLENIRKGSEIFRSNVMNPRQRAVYWIEHVIKFGGEHLHSHALDMEWYEFLMLDIVVLFFTILLVILILSFTVILTVCKFSLKRSTSKEKLS